MDRAGGRGRHALTLLRPRIGARPADVPPPWALWHGATLGLAAVVLLFVNRNQWFFGDEFDFIVSRGLDNPITALFTPHNEHWSTLPILVYRPLLAIFGLHTYWPYILVLIFVHLVLTHLLWRVLLRSGVGSGLSFGLAGVFSVLGAGSENLLWAFQIGFVGSVLFGYAHVLLVDHDGPWDRRDTYGQLCALGGLLCSGIAIPMVVFAGLTVLLRRRRLLPFLMTVGPPAAVFLAWYAVFGRGGRAAIPSSSLTDTLLRLPEYVLTGLTSSLQRFSGFEGAGVLLLLALLAFLAFRSPWDVPVLATAGAVTVVVFFVFVGLGRTQLGVEQAKSSRYAYIAVALLLPLIGVALGSLLRAPLSAPAVTIVLLAGGLQQLQAVSASDARREQSLKQEIVAAGHLVRRGEPLLGRVIEPTYSPDLDLAGLRTLLTQERIPEKVTDPRALLTARARLQTSVDATPATAPLGLVEVVRADGALGRDGCVNITPTGERPQLVLDVPPGGGGATLRSVTDSQISVFATVADLSIVGQPSDYRLARDTVHVLHAVGMQRLIVTLPDRSETKVCGVAQPDGGP